MSDHYDKIIADAEEKLAIQEEAANETRRFINQVCEFAGRDPRYDPTSLLKGAAKAMGHKHHEISRNEYYGRPLAACVRDFLERRMNGKVKEATLDEIFTALEQGNYDLKKSGNDRETQRRGVAISLAKNTRTFHKLPNGDFGLAEWYDNVRKEKRPAKSGNAESDQVSEDEIDDFLESESVEKWENEPTEEAHSEGDDEDI